ncbi:MAG: hypothetical protein ACE361_22670 [Aureliella sp.]
MPFFQSSASFSRSTAAATCMALAVALAPMAAPAQEARIQVLGVGGDEASDELRESVLDGVSSMSFSMAAPGGSISFGGGPMGGINPNNQSQLFQLLSNESVRRELDLSEEQIAGVETIQKETQKRFSELLKVKLMAGGAGGPISLGGDDFQKIMDKNREQAEAAIEEILLPKQMDRIRQLAYQIDIQQNGGIGEALTSGRLGEEIGVHEDQKENLATRAAKIQSEAEQAILAIKTAARAKLFKELAPEQRKEALELLGDYFEFEQPNMLQQLRKSLSKARSSEDAESEAKSKRGKNRKR